MTTKEQGIQKVIDNNPDEYGKLYLFSLEWVKTRMKPFTAEDLRAAFEEKHFKLQQPNLYGAIINTLAKDKVIKKNGTAEAKRPEAHARLIRIWISLTYSQKQSNNRRNDTGQISLFSQAS